MKSSLNIPKRLFDIKSLRQKCDTFSKGANHMFGGNRGYIESCVVSL